MRTQPRLPRRLLAATTTLGVVLAFFVGTTPAVAETAPTVPGTVETVTADALPTVQIDGVVWSQAVVGNTVYAGGSFATARPAGSAAGVNTVTRNNLLAYDITTGNLVTSFVPSLNAQVRAVAASPDGSRIYVGGDFTTANGSSRSRIAAYSTATGQLIASFAPYLNYKVGALIATDTAVYVGGSFTQAGSSSRSYLAAFSASNGALLPWAPVTDGRVAAMVISPDKSKVVVGGAFTTLNGSSNPGYGLGAIDATSGALLPWNVNSLVRDGGDEASIMSLSSDADGVYGAGYVYGSGGNLEGTFRASWDNGDLVWVEDCHGDTYSAFAQGDVVYTASHAHYCGNIGGFPQTSPDWTFHRALAFSKAATQTVTADPYGYYNFAGNPAPTLLHWYPDINSGLYTGLGQGPWNISGNATYVVYGGEFTIVNNKSQQGLVRFATKDVAPNTQGPRVAGADLVPSAVSLTSGTVRLSWQADHDRDNENLTYRVIRDGNNAAPVYEVTAPSSTWKRPAMGSTDTGLAAGSTHTYRLRVSDPFGNYVLGNVVSVTVSSAGSVSAYSTAVLADSPTSYWRLGEPGGTTSSYDWSGWADLAVGDGVTRGATGAINGDDNTASTFSGASTAFGVTPTAVVGPDTFTAEAWVKTTSTSGGKIIGFGNATTGSSSSYDRHVYMDNSGRIWFGVYPGAVRTVNSTTSYNDGTWHHVVAELGAGGMALFVDGKRVAQRTDTTTGQAYSGYWRVGGDTVGGWPSQPRSSYLAGSIDEVAVYPTVLSANQVVNHYVASGRVSPVKAAPADTYGAAVYQSEPDLYWRLGEGAGSTANDASPNAVSGTYRSGVTLGVTGGIAGTTDTATQFNGVNGLVSSDQPISGPTTYSEELWFSTTTTAGGKLIGFGSSPTGTSGSYDRHVYMENDGRLTFGTWTGQTNTITSTSSYNDGQWHHLVATQSGAGMKLYVDGALVGSNPQTGAQDYTGYWRVGGDTTWGPQPFFAGAIDEVAVYSRALDAATVALHHSLGATGEVPNQAPTAAFTSVASKLAVAVDGSGSADADGTVVSYAWDFGDGATGTGVTASHTYAVAGTFPVTLTVADDDGTTGAVSHDTTVVANVAPTASFTVSPTGLAVAVDGSGSADADGTVVSYAWDFGDGATGTGVTASHTYATDGTYPVTLTVADADGTTGAVSHDVTVAAPVGPATYATDAFTRTVTGGLGSADLGGAWTTSGSASNFSVTGAAGVLRLSAAGVTDAAYLSSVSSSDTDLQVTLSMDKPGTGGGTFAGVIGRKVGTADYRSRVKVSSNGAVTIQTQRGDTTLQAAVVSGLTYAAGDKLRLRLQVTGTSPTTVRAKVWPVGTTEPAAWQVSSTDSTAALQSAGGLGLVAYLSGSSTNAPILVAYDDLWAGSTAATPPVEVPNVAPTAAFASAVTNLAVAVDGAGSADSDGAVVSYGWSFGDGTTGTGATASHTYAEAGTYTVTLTVVDDDGATGTVSHPVTVSDPPAVPFFAQDLFGRTAVNSWGVSDIGGAWTTSGAASGFSVADGAGQLRLATAGGTSSSYLAVSATDADVQTTVTLDQPATGGGTYVSLIGRRVVGVGDYRSRLKISSTGAVQLQFQRSNTTVLAVNVAGLTYTPGSTLHLRLQVTGTAPTTVRAKVWLDGQPEPSWQIVTTDSTAALQVAGGLGVSGYLSASSTAIPVVVRFDDLTAAPTA